MNQKELNAIRDLAEIQREIDLLEEQHEHDKLPPRYDALVALRNARLDQTPLAASCTCPTPARFTTAG